jgi:hypothetical protein
MSAFRKTQFHATPMNLLFSLVLDLVWLGLFKPQGAVAVAVFIIFLPGWDLVTGTISFINYLRANRSNSKQ